MTKKNLPLSKIYGLLESGPVVMITTAAKGKANIMTMSWHTMMDFEPPLVGLVIGEGSLTFSNLLKAKECVINIPTVELANQVVGCGNASGRDTDKIKVYHLTTAAASCVKPPLIDECYANLECKLVDSKMASRYNFFVVEVVKAWINPSCKNPKTVHHLGWGHFMVAGKTIRLPSRMR